jgi:hypothetical protein
MYWPVGTPRVFATSSSRASSLNNLIISHDGQQPPSSHGAERPPLLTTGSSAQDAPTTPITPATPATPMTPAIKSVEQDYHDVTSPRTPLSGSGSAAIPIKEPILAMRVARPGHLFAVITATSITIWQIKVPLYPEMASSIGSKLTCWGKKSLL